MLHVGSVDLNLFLSFKSALSYLRIAPTNSLERVYRSHISYNGF